MHHCPVLGLVPGPGDVLGVGLVVLGVSVPMPPAAPHRRSDETNVCSTTGIATMIMTFNEAQLQTLRYCGQAQLQPAPRATYFCL